MDGFTNAHADAYTDTQTDTRTYGSLRGRTLGRVMYAHFYVRTRVTRYNLQRIVGDNTLMLSHVLDSPT